MQTLWVRPEFGKEGDSGPRTFLETRVLKDTLAAVCKLQVLRDLGEAPPPPPPQEDYWSPSEIMDPAILVYGSTSYSESNRRSSDDPHGVLAEGNIVSGSTSSAESKQTISEDSHVAQEAAWRMGEALCEMQEEALQQTPGPSSSEGSNRTVLPWQPPY